MTVGTFKPIFSIKQQKLIDAVVQRGGAIMPGELSALAEEIGASLEFVDKNLAIPEIIDEIRHRLSYTLPVATYAGQMAYLQKMLDEQIQFRKAVGLPMSDKDPLDIVDIARRVVPNEPQRRGHKADEIFDFSTLSKDQLEEAISALAAIVETLPEISVVDVNSEEVSGDESADKS